MLLTDKTFKDAPKLKLARKLGQEDVRSGPRVAEPSSESGVLDGGAELGEDLGEGFGQVGGRAIPTVDEAGSPAQGRTMFLDMPACTGTMERGRT